MTKKIFGVDIEGAYEKYVNKKEKNKVVDTRSLEEQVGAIKVYYIPTIYVQTKTQTDYWTLMWILEKSGWEFNSELPTLKHYYWHAHKEQSCISPSKINHEHDKIIILGLKKDLDASYGNVVTTDEYYDLQKIEPEKIKLINQYFENKK